MTDNRFLPQLHFTAIAEDQVGQTSLSKTEIEKPGVGGPGPQSPSSFFQTGKDHAVRPAMEIIIAEATNRIRARTRFADKLAELPWLIHLTRQRREQSGALRRKLELATQPYHACRFLLSIGRGDAARHCLRACRSTQRKQCQARMVARFCVSVWRRGRGSRDECVFNTYDR